MDIRETVDKLIEEKDLDAAVEIAKLYCGGHNIIGKRIDINRLAVRVILENKFPEKIFKKNIDKK